MTSEATVRKMVEKRFAIAGLHPVAIQVRSFPGETIAIVEVDSDYEKALQLAEELGAEIENGFVTIRKVPAKGKAKRSNKIIRDVHDERIAKLIELMNARARSSEHQPSLRYIQDVEESLKLALSPRHHLIFGRRGVGKTSLLLEAKRKLEVDGTPVLWVNMHSLRGLGIREAFLDVASRLCHLAVATLLQAGKSASGAMLKEVLSAIDAMQHAQPMGRRPGSIVPKLQQAIARFCMEAHVSIYIFLDDIHYLPRANVPQFLDWMHGLTRDNPVWLKIAGIQHQTRWFIQSPPTGMQTGHDAAIINLDITLERPEKAKAFLQNVLRGYVEECDASPYSKFLSAPAVERLVLAAGGVPRDFLTLCASSLQTARGRDNARTLGVQDVNNAAGIAAKTKLQELEDDAAASQGNSRILVAALNCVRNFLLTEKKFTFFRVDFRDKEAHAAEYRLLQALADLRMLHLINGSLSDPHQAGHRSEVYLLDLSEYSGSRLKQKLTVLDFERSHIVLKRTRSKDEPKVGDSPLRLVALLRAGPLFALNVLSEIAAELESGH